MNSKPKLKIYKLIWIFALSALMVNSAFASAAQPVGVKQPYYARVAQLKEENTGCKYDSYIWLRNFWDDVVCDYSIYYGKENLMWLGGTFLLTGFSANTKMDQTIRRFWQRNLRSHATDEFFRLPNFLGGHNYIRYYVAGIGLGSLGNTQDACMLYQWGYRSLRTMILVSPQATFLSWFLGVGKPADTDSKWRFFKKKSDAGISAHAFNGAIPFFTAGMMTDNCVWRYAWYTAALLPGLSRINKDQHYFSQVFLGWAIAYLSAKAVDQSDYERACGCPSDFYVSMAPLNKGARVSAVLRF